MNADPFDAVLFDLDGTLIDTAPEIGEALNLTLEELGFPRADAVQVRAWIGHGTRHLVSEALALRQGPDGAIKLDSVMPRFSRNHRRVVGRIGPLYPGVRETLNALAAHGVPMGLLSNKEGEFGRQLLHAHQLHDFFEVTVFGDTLAQKKPAPLMVQHCLRELRSTPPRTLLVGDSEIDVAAARNAGVPVWVMSYGYRQARSARELHADRVLDSLLEVLPHLRPRRAICRDRAQAGAE